MARSLKKGPFVDANLTKTKLCDPQLANCEGG